MKREMPRRHATFPAHIALMKYKNWRVFIFSRIHSNENPRRTIVFSLIKDTYSVEDVYVICHRIPGEKQKEIWQYP